MVTLGKIYDFKLISANKKYYKSDNLSLIKSFHLKILFVLKQKS